MRSVWRTLAARLGPELLRAIALVWVADLLVGVSYGAISVSGGLPVWQPILYSLVVFAGAAQFLFTAVLTDGGSVLAAVLAGLLVNARHVAFGFSMAPLLAGPWWRRALGSHLMIDESVAFALAQRGLDARRAAYWTCGIGLFACWNVGVAIGAVAGTAISDTDALGLDAALPAVLLALVLPSLTDGRVRLAALAGTGAALALTPFLPPGMPVLAALAGLLVGGRWRPRSPDAPPAGAPG